MQIFQICVVARRPCVPPHVSFTYGASAVLADYRLIHSVQMAPMHRPDRFTALEQHIGSKRVKFWACLIKPDDECDITHVNTTPVRSVLLAGS